MGAYDLLVQALVREQGFVPLSELPAEAAAPPAPEGIDFTAGRDQWGSVATTGLVRADGLTAEEIARRAEAFHALVQLQHAHAGALVVSPRIGKPTHVQLGSFGVLCFVFEQGAPPALVEHVRKLKRGSLGEKQFMVAWSVDAPLRTVHKHKGLPLGVVPSAKDLQNVLHRLG